MKDMKMIYGLVPVMENLVNTMLIKEMPNLALDEMIIKQALKTQERIDEESDGFVSVD
jgi:hypothetical protein